MACTISITPAIGAADWSNFPVQVGQQRKGYQAVSLTDFAASAASHIATGGIMELAGSLYTFTDTAISLAAGTPSAAQAVYYTVIPTGAGTVCTVVMEGTAPTFVSGKQGYYASAASLTRYIGGAYLTTLTSFRDKWLYHDIDTGIQAIKIYGDGRVGMASDADIDGALAANGLYFRDVTAGANLFLYEDSEKTTASGTYVKIKEILCLADGIVTTKFDMKSSNASYQAFGKIYVNGVAAGAEHANASTSYNTQTDASITVQKEDLIQVYAHGESGITAYVINFRIYCDETVPASIKILFADMGIS